MLPHGLAAVEEIPKFWPLIFWIPLAELIAMREEALLGAGLFLVASRAAQGAVELVLLDRRQQSRRLQSVAAGFAGRLDSDAVADGVQARLDQSGRSNCIGW